MSKNVIPIPSELYAADLPPGYDCALFIGRMAGRLSPMPGQPSIQQFSFEITDVNDPTEMVLRYTTYHAPAAELARWENVGDTVGIVMASGEKGLDMVLAYNFTRRKWFATNYYPHVQGKGLEDRLSVDEIRKYMIPAVLSIFCCVGFVALPILMAVGSKKDQQYKVINPTNFRGVTAKRVATWVAENGPALASAGHPDIDPSL